MNSPAYQGYKRDTHIPSKPEATVIAHLALTGHTVHRLAAGGWLVAKFGQMRECPDLESLEQFAKRVGAMR